MKRSALIPCLMLALTVHASVVAAAASALQPQSSTPSLCTWIGKAEIKSLLGGRPRLQIAVEGGEPIECIWRMAGKSLMLSLAPRNDLTAVLRPDSPGYSGVMMPSFRPAITYFPGYSGYGNVVAYAQAAMTNREAELDYYRLQSELHAAARLAPPNPRQTLDTWQPRFWPEAAGNAFAAKLTTASGRLLALVFACDGVRHTMTPEQDSAARAMAARVIERY
jgi:hypothetical protein